MLLHPVIEEEEGESHLEDWAKSKGEGNCVFGVCTGTCVFGVCTRTCMCASVRVPMRDQGVAARDKAD